MDEDEEMAELRAQEARRVRDEAKKCLRHASFQLEKAAYEIDEYLKDFSTARIPIRRQVILNEAIAHLVANVLPNLGIAEMARVQVQLALRDYQARQLSTEKAAYEIDEYLKDFRARIPIRRQVILNEAIAHLEPAKLRNS
jgi:hypothetical protein